MTGRWRLVALAAMLLLASCRARLSTLDPPEIADRARPAIVPIFTRVEATGSIPNIEFDTNRLATDAGIQAGDSREEKLEKYYRTFLSSPEEYLRDGDKTIPVKTGVMMLGTGFIVTTDGYILTNAHVVKPDKEDVAKAVVEKISDQVEQNEQDFQREFERMLPGQTISDDAAGRLKSAFMKQYVKSATLDYNTEVIAVLSTPGPDGKPDARPCDIKKLGEPTPGKDVAVLKIEGRNLPTLALAQGVESGSVTTGSELLIMGYPGKVFEDPDITLASRLQPSLTFGHVSGIREMAGGFRVIQTDAPINHGNSGGPALNIYGQVVGQATFGEEDSQGLNFAIDIGVAREFLQELNVTPSGSSHASAGRPSSRDSGRDHSRESGRETGSGNAHKFPVGIVLLLIVLVGVAVAVAFAVSRN